jgi:hypothetical protein
MGSKPRIRSKLKPSRKENARERRRKLAIDSHFKSNKVNIKDLIEEEAKSCELDDFKIKFFNPKAKRSLK